MIRPPRASAYPRSSRDEVVQAVADGKFHIWPVRTVDEGVEILTGVPAGERGEDGAYPEESVNGRVDRKLLELAQRLQRFGQNEREKTHRNGEPETAPEPPLPGEQPEPEPPEPELPGDRPEPAGE